MKIAPAVAAGCTIVLKTSEKAPLTVGSSFLVSLTCANARQPTLCAKFAHEVGFPPGVINVLNGHGTPSGATLASHMDIRMVNFTGSTMTGKKIQQMAAGSNLKKVVLELGGKSPAIIFEDADIVKAATATSASMQMLMGQACVANSRIYVQESVADKFKEAFIAMCKAAKKGDPLLPETQQGPQADQLQHERIQTFLQAATEGKGKLESGGKPAQVDGKGYFIEPTVYSNVDENEKTQKVSNPTQHVACCKTNAQIRRRFSAPSSTSTHSKQSQRLSRRLMQQSTVYTPPSSRKTSIVHSAWPKLSSLVPLASTVRARQWRWICLSVVTKALAKVGKDMATALRNTWSIRLR